MHDLQAQIPKFLVLRVQQDDGAGGLHIEGARGVFEGEGDDVVDPSVRDRAFVVELVDRATVFDGYEKFAGRHDCLEFWVSRLID